MIEQTPFLCTVRYTDQPLRAVFGEMKTRSFGNSFAAGFLNPMKFVLILQNLNPR
jgi:hypothetical protein